MINLPVGELYPHPDNPRKELGDLTELAASISANGIFQNLTVVPGHVLTEKEYQDACAAYKESPSEDLRQLLNSRKSEDGYTVIIGHRRLAAAKEAGLQEVPCVIAWEMSPQEQLQTMLLENMQRSDLTVYEQARGFQQLLDFGCSIDEIAQKSGFSVTTVRRRAKMAELDSEKLKAVATRQLSLTDFDKLAKIENVKVRNKVLSDIGTNNFDWAVKNAIRKQEVKKVLLDVKRALKDAGFQQLPKGDRFSSKYDNMFNNRINLEKWDKEKSKMPKEKERIFYELDIDYGYLNFYMKHKKAAPVQRPQEEIDKEKAIKAKWAELDQLVATCYELRKSFIEQLKCNKNNVTIVFKGALYAGLCSEIRYLRRDRKMVLQLMGIDSSNEYSDEADKQKSLSLRDFSWVGDNAPRLVYSLFGDGPEKKCAGDYKKHYPAYRASDELQALYYWLTELGYEMSDAERQLCDGTHPVFAKGGGGNEPE